MQMNHNPWKAFIVLSKPFLYGGLSLLVIMLAVGLFVLPADIWIILLYPALCILPGTLIAYNKRARFIKNSYDFKMNAYLPEFTKAVSYIKSNEGKLEFYKIATIIMICLWSFCVLIYKIPYREAINGGGNLAVLFIYVLIVSNFVAYALITTVFEMSIVTSWGRIKLHYKEYGMKNDPSFLITNTEAEIIKRNRVMMWDNDDLG